MNKVLFQLPKADWHSVSTETLWATPMGEDTFRLENSPFYASGYSFLDVVEAFHSQEYAMPVVFRAIQKSGHSTYALWVIEGVESSGKFAIHWQPLEDLGCSYEGVRGQLLSVDVPPKTDISKAYRLMEDGESAGAWYVQEQDFAHTVPNPSFQRTASGGR